MQNAAIKTSGTHPFPTALCRLGTQGWYMPLIWLCLCADQATVKLKLSSLQMSCFMQYMSCSCACSPVCWLQQMLASTGKTQQPHVVSNCLRCSLTTARTAWHLGACITYIHLSDLTVPALLVITGEKKSATDSSQSQCLSKIHVMCNFSLHMQGKASTVTNSDQTTVNATGD